MSGSQIKAQLREIINSLILDKHPEATDDMHADVLSNGENRDEARDRLTEMNEFYREDL